VPSFINALANPDGPWGDRVAEALQEK